MIPRMGAQRLAAGARDVAVAVRDLVEVVRRSLTNTQPVSGPVTDAQLRAAPVKVSAADTAAVSLSDVYVALKLLVNLMARPMWTEALTGRVRVALESAAVTMTGVTTLTNLVQMGSTNVQDGIVAEAARGRWAMAVRQRIT